MEQKTRITRTLAAQVLSEAGHGEG
jgi:hypothetical protein